MSLETVSMASEQKLEKEDLDITLENVTAEDVLQKVQPVQTDRVTEESSVNTDPDWESHLEALSKYSTSLVEKYNSLTRQQEEDDLTCKKDKEQLQKKKAEAICQHQALLDKLESVRVKRQLNNSKVTRKNFLPKKQEMILEKNKAEEEKNRLAKELEDKEKQLTALIEEQTEEQQKWQKELEELKREVEQVQKEVEEATLRASQNEIAAVEKQREVAMAHIETWQKEVEQYLNALTVEFPQQNHHERQNWQKKESLVRKNQAELQKRFEEVLQKLQQGQKLESLPRIDVPSLPQVPAADLKLKQMRPSPAQPQFMPPPPDLMNRPSQRPKLYPSPSYPQYHPRQHHIPPDHRFPAHLRFPAHHCFPRPHLPPHHYHPPPLPQPEYLAQMGPSSRTPPPNFSPSPPVQPPHGAVPSAPAPAAASATNILEKLGTRFPQCEMAQLISLLQQVKSSRGTLAGMSIDEATEQIRLLLARGETAPGPISRPLSHNSVQRPLPSMHRPGGGGHTGGPGKFCLICQNLVDRKSRYPLSCSHTIHTDCIQTWLQSSKNNSCPFCLTVV